MKQKNFILFSNLTLSYDRTHNLMFTGESPSADYSISFHSRWWDQQGLAPIPYNFWCNVDDQTTMSAPCLFEKKVTHYIPIGYLPNPDDDHERLHEFIYECLFDLYLAGFGIQGSYEWQGKTYSIEPPPATENLELPQDLMVAE